MIMMIIDKPRAKVQREPRRQANHQPAAISVDGGLTMCECFVMDVSPGGAKIMTDAEVEVGERIRLALVPAHHKLQPCEVVWRRGNTYGIKFVI
jgi:hypothetical protein